MAGLKSGQGNTFWKQFNLMNPDVVRAIIGHTL